MQVTMVSSLPTTFVYIWHYGPTTYNIFSQLKNCYMKNRLRNKVMASHSSTLAWKIPWMEETDRLQSMGLQRVRHDWATSLHTVEVTNRFKKLDLIECPKNYGQKFMTLYRRQWSILSPRKRNAKRQNDCLRRPYK